MSQGFEATALMTGREPFIVPPMATGQKSSQSQGTHQMHLAYGAGSTYNNAPDSSLPPYQPVRDGSTGDMTMTHAPSLNRAEPMKRKRGRPRKYGPEGNMGLGLSSAQHQAGVTQSPPLPAGTFSASAAPASPTVAASPLPQQPSGGSNLPTSSKKGRGRPRGSSNKPRTEALGSTGTGFTPHVINVNVGEDVSSKIMTLSQNGPRAICVLSANGAISNVTLRQPATSGGTATYEGWFDILSLCGSFMQTEFGGQKSRTGGLSISLSGPDGRVLGGGVAGLLTAASPVQVIVGSFIAVAPKESNLANKMEPSPAPAKFNMGGGGATGVSSSASHGSESSGGLASPLNQSTGPFNNMSTMQWN